MPRRPRRFVVYTRSGPKRHVAPDGNRYTFCGREHMGFTVPSTGAPVARYQPHMAEGACRICVRLATRGDR
jgi:hypothetical protein